MTVYVVCNQRELDPKRGLLKPKFDFSPAKQYGEIKFVLPQNATPFVLETPLVQIREALAEFSDEDYLLLVGNPILIGLTVAIAADRNDGCVRMLQWSGARKCYIPVYARDIFGEYEDDCQGSN